MKFVKMRRGRIVIALIILFVVICFLYWPRRWKYIVIHHSAGNYGNIEHLQEIHNQRQSKEPVNAIAYHYVIGNGNGMENGKVESDLRKKYNLWGVHVSAHNTDRNFRGLGICVIGNLDEKKMTPEQYQSLLELTFKLMEEYDIDFEHVGFHGKLPGESTHCPGKFFPYDKFSRDLKEKIAFSQE